MGIAMFTDVSRDYKDWDAISYVIETDFMSGFPDGTFRPYEKMALGDVCIVLSRLFPSERGKIRLSLEHWTLGYVVYCKEKGLLPDSISDPCGMCDAFVTNEQLGQTVALLEDRLDLTTSDIDRPCSELGSLSAPVTRISLAKALYALAKAANQTFCLLIDPSRYNEALRLLNKHREVEYYRYYKQFLSPDISHAYDILLSCSHENDYVAFSAMLKIAELKHAHFSSLTARDKIFHYTSLNVLQKLIQPGGRLRLSPIAYLNDPTEGTTGVELAERVMRDKAYGPFFTNWERRYLKGVFVASFIVHSSEDQQKNGSIPMWGNYGHDGKGCAISIDSAALGTTVYKVCYQEKDATGRPNDGFSRYLSDLSKLLDDYFETIRTGNEWKPEKDPVFVFAKDAIEQVCYLYKTAYYSYEEEARIIRFVPLRDAERTEEILDGEVFPRIYSELEQPLQISSVILGPKVAAPERVAVALANHGIDVENIYLSKIPYR